MPTWRRRLWKMHRYRPHGDRRRSSHLWLALEALCLARGQRDAGAVAELVAFWVGRRDERGVGGLSALSVGSWQAQRRPSVW